MVDFDADWLVIGILLEQAGSSMVERITLYGE
jgi:hypothetical protein